MEVSDFHTNLLKRVKPESMYHIVGGVIKKIVA